MPFPPQPSPQHRIHREFNLPVRLCRFSTRRYRHWAGLALALIAARIALLPVLPPPQPMYPDEFSYLLAGDTFAHGRVANPTPPLPEFFESPHVLVRPVYASKYPPGQGFALALGQKLLGHPYAGVVLSGALLIFLCCWAADAWLPPQWSLVTGGLAWILFFVRHYWLTSYWGGNAAACGGALVLGGLGYFLRERWATARWSLPAGAAILFFTRPFEGGLLCAATLITMGWHFIRLPAEKKKIVVFAIAAPGLVILAPAGILAGWYNLRVSGQVSVLPYIAHMRQYDQAPAFWVLPPLPPKQYSNVDLEKVHGAEAASYRELRSFPLRHKVMRQAVFLLVNGVWVQFSSFGLLLAGVVWARTRASRNWLLGILGIGWAGMLVQTWIFPHYTAPFTVGLLILIVASMRALWYRMAALRLGGLVFALALAILVTPVFLDYLNALQTPRTTPRSRVIQQLQDKGGRHLVFVDCADGWVPWAPNGEWVYNGAELESSAVIVAHLRGDGENRQLLDEYRDRTAWVMRLGPQPEDAHLTPYVPPVAAAAR